MRVWRQGRRIALPVWLLLLCWGCGPDHGGGPTQNRNPVIEQGPSADKTTVSVAEDVAVTVSASDPDGDTLSYAWSATGGSFPQGTVGANAVWRSPDSIAEANQSFVLTVDVRDGKGGTASGSVAVTVTVPVSTNRAPSIDSGPTAARTTLMVGESVDVSVVASDPDGDALAYAWSATGGSFTAGQDASQATWRAPDTVEGNGQTFVLNVQVTDGRGGLAEKSLDTVVRPVANLNAVIQ